MMLPSSTIRFLVPTAALVALAACRSAPPEQPTAMDSIEESQAHAEAMRARTAEATAATEQEFQVEAHDDHVWVFRKDSPEAKSYEEHGAPAESVTQLGAGPGGVHLRGTDSDTLHDYRYAKPGFYVDFVEGRLWVFRGGSDAQKEYLATGEPAKSITQVGAGPDGVTLRGADAEVLAEYLLAKPGFTTVFRDELGWIFRDGSDALAQFQEHGEPAKSVTLIGEGPNGMSLRGPDEETLVAYLYTKPGFWIDVVDDRVWIFLEGSEALEEYRKTGEPAKSATRIGAGPDGRTLRAENPEVIDFWLGA